MNEMPVSPDEVSEAPKKSKTPIIIAIVVIVLLCCCCLGLGGAWWLWNNGDALLGVSQVLPRLIA